MHKRFATTFNFYFYLSWKINSSTTGYGIELIKDFKVVIPMSESINIKLNLPTFLSRSNKYTKENMELKMFFDVENGSIAVSQAKCTTHHINIALSAKYKRFTKTFLDAIIVLQLAADVLHNIVYTFSHTCI
jgi:hypothetical protein